ncbi:hypothetical protein WBG99_00990 [Streptomyces sp. TG1A-60]|uniref:hypothetical protein n=1 Tax=Streptomyces sp. TG1A-60 TaxID=3129111 RepID=UPI0030CFB074
MKFRQHLAQVRRNMCALPNDSLEAMATLFFSSRSFFTKPISDSPLALAALSMVAPLYRSGGAAGRDSGGGRAGRRLTG